MFVEGILVILTVCCLCFCFYLYYTTRNNKVSYDISDIKKDINLYVEQKKAELDSYTKRNTDDLNTFLNNIL